MNQLFEAPPEPLPGAEEPLIHGVLLDTDHRGDLGIREVVPSGEP